jgi:chemotaxis protein MotA
MFKLVQAKGVLALEPHIEDPGELSAVPALPDLHAKNHHAVESSCATTCAW